MLRMPVVTGGVIVLAVRAFRTTHRQLQCRRTRIGIADEPQPANQAFAAQLARECLDERVVGGLARAGEVQVQTALVCPQIHVQRDKLPAIAHIDHLWVADCQARLFQPDNHVSDPIADPQIDHRQEPGFGDDHGRNADVQPVEMESQHPHIAQPTSWGAILQGNGAQNTSNTQIAMADRLGVNG